MIARLHPNRAQRPYTDRDLRRATADSIEGSRSVVTRKVRDSVAARRDFGAVYDVLLTELSAP